MYFSHPKAEYFVNGVKLSIRRNYLMPPPCHFEMLQIDIFIPFYVIVSSFWSGYFLSDTRSVQSIYLARMLCDFDHLCARLMLFIHTYLICIFRRYLLKCQKVEFFCNNYNVSLWHLFYVTVVYRCVDCWQMYIVNWNHYHNLIIEIFQMNSKCEKMSFWISKNVMYDKCRFSISLKWSCLFL